jgi:hypothetical protein
MIGPLDAQTEMQVSNLQALRRQEESGYQSHDYLHQQAPQRSPASGPQTPSSSSSAVDAECRFRMAEWCYQIVDYCKFQRDTVAITMKLVDRLLSTPAAAQEILNDRGVFQLATMTSLYTAVKIHEPEAIEPSLIASLSRGSFTSEQVEAMEFKILNALQWRVNPPTALFFVQQYLDLVPSHILNDKVRAAVLEVAKFQTELAVCDYDLSTVNASSIAFAALLNALESLDHQLDPKIAAQIEITLAEAALIDSRSSQLSAIRIRLYEAIHKQPGHALCSSLTPQQTTSSSSIPEEESADDELHNSTKSCGSSSMTDDHNSSSPRSVAVTASSST